MKTKLLILVLAGVLMGGCSQEDMERSKPNAPCYLYADYDVRFLPVRCLNYFTTQQTSLPPTK